MALCTVSIRGTGIASKCTRALSGSSICKVQFICVSSASATSHRTFASTTTTNAATTNTKTRIAKQLYVIPKRTSKISAYSETAKEAYRLKPNPPRDIPADAQLGSETPVDFTVQLREDTGKYVAHGLRQIELIPGIIFGGPFNKKPLLVAVPKQPLALAVAMDLNFFNRVYYIKVEGMDEIQKVIPNQVHRDGSTGRLNNVTFTRFAPNHKIKLNIPVVIEGMEDCVGNSQGGILTVLRHALPCYFRATSESIPPAIYYNCMNLQIGQSVHVSQLEIPKSLTPVLKDDFVIMSCARRSKDE